MDGKREDEEREVEADDALTVALAAYDFDAARSYVRESTSKGSPYRHAGAEVDPATATLERAIDRLAAGDAVGAFFTVVDSGAVGHVLAPSMFTAIAAACEAIGELEVARAAFLESDAPDEALRLEQVIPRTTEAMEAVVHEAGIAHHERRLGEATADIFALEGLAQRHAALGAAKTAADIARRAVELAPTRPVGWLVLIEAERDLEAFEAAERTARAACEACPDHAVIWAARGELLEHEERHEEALGMYEKALEKDESHWPAHLGVERALSITDDRQRLAAHVERMARFAERAGEEERVADLRDTLRAELADGEAVLDARRAIQQRKREHEEEIESLIRGPESVPEPASRRARLAVSAVVALAALVVAVLLVTR